MTFEADLTSRNAADYVDFLIPHLAPGFHLLDAGCGGGSISVGLARRVGHVMGVYLDAEEFADAQLFGKSNAHSSPALSSAQPASNMAT